MKAVVLAAGRGHDLEPLTAELPAAMVPVLDRPVLAHTLGLLRRQGAEEVIAVLRRHAKVVTDFFGDELSYRFESRPMGTAGAVGACADALGDEPFVVLSGAVLTDLDVERLMEVHRGHGGIATICATEVPDAEGLGLVHTDGDGRLSALFENAEPGPGVVNCALYAFSPEIFEHVPPGRRRDWGRDVLPELLGAGIPVHVHRLEDEYWAPLRTPEHLRRAVFDLLEGEVELPIGGEHLENGLTLGEGARLDGIAMIEPPVWIGDRVHIGQNTRLQGPLVIGDDATVGDGAQLRGSVVMPGSVVPRETVLIGAIAGHARSVDHTRPRWAGG